MTTVKQIIKKVDSNALYFSHEEVEVLLVEIERLKTDLNNLKQQMLIDGHTEDCAAVQAASIDCSCGKRGVNSTLKLY